MLRLLRFSPQLLPGLTGLVDRAFVFDRGDIAGIAVEDHRPAFPSPDDVVLDGCAADLQRLVPDVFQSDALAFAIQRFTIGVAGRPGSQPAKYML